MSISQVSKVALVLAIVASIASPALAEKNTGRYKQSVEAVVMQKMVDCTFYKNMLDIAERDAGARAGTKAAEKYSKEADMYWQKGADAGCGWAA